MPLASLFEYMACGYAAAATMVVTSGTTGWIMAGHWGHPQRVVDFGWRAVQRTTVAKHIVAHALGRAPAENRLCRAVPTAGAMP